MKSVRERVSWEERERHCRVGLPQDLKIGAQFIIGNTAELISAIMQYTGIPDPRSIRSPGQTQVYTSKHSVVTSVLLTK